MTIVEELSKLDFLTLRQAADVCHYKGTEPLKRAVRRGELPCITLSNAQVLFPREAFLKWLAQHGTRDVNRAFQVDTVLKPGKAPTRALKAIAAKRKARAKRRAKSALNDE